MHFEWDEDGMKEKPTKKISNRTAREDDLRAQYDASLIRSGVRGKYAEWYRASTNLVLLAPDVAAVFRDAKAVNEALRILIKAARRSPARAS